MGPWEACGYCGETPCSCMSAQEPISVKPDPKAEARKGQEMASAWATAQGEERVIPPVGKERLKELARGVIASEMFLSSQVRDEAMLPMVFAPLLFGAFKDWLPEELEQIGGFYGPWSSALPRGINGYPMLTTMGVLNREDWKKLHEMIRKMEAALAAVDDG